jgi:hypothetical protein
MAKNAQNHVILAHFCGISSPAAGSFAGEISGFRNFLIGGTEKRRMRQKENLCHAMHTQLTHTYNPESSVTTSL